MRRSRKARQADDRQMAFTLAVEALVTTTTGRMSAPMKPPVPKNSYPVPYVVRGIFRFSNGRERECSVCAVSPSPKAFPDASEQLIARMRESGWHFAEGSALLMDVLDTQAKEEQPMPAAGAKWDRTRAGRPHTPHDEGGAI